MGALTGIRVVDMSRLLPGPLASLFLAAFGAEVIKVEMLPRGDPLRWRRDQPREPNKAFDILNRNKLSLAVDVRRQEGLAVLRRLLEEADVFIESFRPGVAAQMGIDADTVLAWNPRIVYASLSGFGQTGPASRQPGHDINFLARSGILAQLKDASGRPVLPGVAIADVGAGAYLGVVGILVALWGREKTGIGQHVDIALLDGLLPFLMFPWTSLVNEGAPLLHTGRYACYNVYRTADSKYLALGMMETKYWAAFCHKVHHPEWTGCQFDPSAQPRIISELTALFASDTRDSWLVKLKGEELGISPVVEFSDIFTDPQLRARDVVSKIQTGAGILPTFGVPVRLTRMAASLGGRAPALGEHTELVLRAIGHDQSAIDELLAKGVAFQAGPRP